MQKTDFFFLQLQPRSTLPRPDQALYAPAAGSRVAGDEDSVQSEAHVDGGKGGARALFFSFP